MSLDKYAQLFMMLASRNEQDVTEILRRIRGGHDADAIVQAMAVKAPDSAIPAIRGLAIEAFLVNLAHSTGSLKEVITYATSKLSPSAYGALPNPLDYSLLRNRTVRLLYVEALFQRIERSNNRLPAPIMRSITNFSAERSPSTLDPLDDPLEYDSNFSIYDSPPHLVPALPWTNIATSDAAVSHLISLFLAWINPSWRFVEQDLFLRGMFL